MDWLKDWLGQSPLALVFLVVAFGYLLGEVRFPGNFRLGISGVLFVGLAVGAWAPALAVPEAVQSLGLVLSVYCIGLLAGPGFFQNFRQHGLKLNAAVAIAFAAALAVCALLAATLGWSGETITGLFCGALTNTSAMGAARELMQRTGSDEAHLNALVVGYGLAYPFALVATLGLIHLCAGREKPSGRASGPPKPARSILTLEVQTARPDGAAWRVAQLAEQTGLVFTRFQQPGGKVELAHPDTELPIGTRVIAVGSPAQMQAAIELIGATSADQLQESLKGFEIYRYFVSRPELAGRTLGELSVNKLGGVVTRIRRGDVDLPVRDSVILHLGDRVRVLCYAEREPEIRAFFGNSVTALTETGYFSFGLGICFGIAVGMIAIPLPGLENPFQLGLAGGSLVVALALGALGRTGPIIWNLPNEVNLTLRNLGNLLFLAGVGVKAGSAMPGALANHGALLIAAGIGLALATQGAFWAAARYLAKADTGAVMGAMAGLQTQPAALALANSRLEGGSQNMAYATVYPLAVVGKIVLAQILIGLLH